MPVHITVHITVLLTTQLCTHSVLDLYGKTVTCGDTGLKPTLVESLVEDRHRHGQVWARVLELGQGVVHVGVVLGVEPVVVGLVTDAVLAPQEETEDAVSAELVALSWTSARRSHLGRQIAAVSTRLFAGSSSSFWRTPARQCNLHSSTTHNECTQHSTPTAARCGQRTPNLL